nr:MAG TPA: homoglutathione synthetase [Caudoviricetes sp.]
MEWGFFGLRGRKTLGSLSEVAKAFTQRPTRPVALPTGGIACGYGLFDCSSLSALRQ